MGTLSSSFAQRLMEQDGAINVVAYPTPVEPTKTWKSADSTRCCRMSPLRRGTPDPTPIDQRGRAGGFRVVRGRRAAGFPEFRRRIDWALRGLLSDGTAERIYRKWSLWTPAQAGSKRDVHGRSHRAGRRTLGKYLGLILRGAGVTLALSVLSMTLAVVAGFALCLGRMHGASSLNPCASCIWR